MNGEEYSERVKVREFVNYVFVSFSIVNLQNL